MNASRQCANGHNFDIAKEGYVNLLTGHSKSKYDRALFRARRELNESTHLFDPVIQVMVEWIHQLQAPKLNLLDAGSGEGYLTHLLYQLLTKDGQTLDVLGMDIAKEGVRLASKSYPMIDWVVGDLANIPIATDEVDLIVNILSPSNYEEFNRILKSRGHIIKVIPRSDYLVEIRQHVYRNSDKATYENTNVAQLFKENYSVIEQIPLNYNVTLTPSQLEMLLQMTPLTWNLTNDQIESLLKTHISTITMSFDVMIGIHE